MIAPSGSAQRVEIAHVCITAGQQSRRAFANARELDRSRNHQAAEARLRGRMRVESSPITTRYQSCMGGWGRKLMLIDPAGDALPCHAARVILICNENVIARPLAWIWQESPSFQNFAAKTGCPTRAAPVIAARWRLPPAMLLRATPLTDPVCSLAKHEIVTAIVDRANQQQRTPTQPIPQPG
jgi:pyrroloquinoline quinone biosynthesis protein E